MTIKPHRNSHDVSPCGACPRDTSSHDANAPLKMLAIRPLEKEAAFFKQAERDLGCVVDIHPRSLSLEEIEVVSGYDVVISQPGRMDEVMIQALRSHGVRMLQTMSVGVDHIDFDAAERHGLIVKNITYSPSSVAEYAVMLTLMLLRRARPLSARMAVGDYRVAPYMGQELHTKTVGIFGAGTIGMTTARLFAGFGARVLAYSPSKVGSAPQDGIEFVDEHTLIAESDVISIHAPATDKTRRFFNAEIFAQMKADSYLINTARGDLVCLGDLIDALEAGHLQGAALDVIENDRTTYFRDTLMEVVPNRELALLKNMPNVIMYPHCAYFTETAAHDYCYGAVVSAYNTLSEGGR